MVVKYALLFTFLLTEIALGEPQGRHQRKGASSAEPELDGELKTRVEVAFRTLFGKEPPEAQSCKKWAHLPTMPYITGMYLTSPFSLPGYDPVSGWSTEEAKKKKKQSQDFYKHTQMFTKFLRPIYWQAFLTEQECTYLTEGRKSNKDLYMPYACQPHVLRLPTNRAKPCVAKYIIYPAIGWRTEN